MNDMWRMNSLGPVGKYTMRIVAKDFRSFRPFELCKSRSKGCLYAPSDRECREELHRKLVFLWILAVNVCVFDVFVKGHGFESWMDKVLEVDVDYEVCLDAMEKKFFKCGRDGYSWKYFEIDLHCFMFWNGSGFVMYGWKMVMWSTEMVFEIL